MKPRKRQWFHCTDRFHGERFTAERRPPLNRGPGEPDTPRLCVGPSVAACFAARLFGGRDVLVYRTAAPRSAVKPVGVNDACLTGEMWLVPPVVMELAYVVPAPMVDRASEATRRRVMERWASGHFSPLTPLERLCGYREAIMALDDGFSTPGERKFVERAIAYFEATEAGKAA